MPTTQKGGKVMKGGMDMSPQYGMPPQQYGMQQQPYGAAGMMMGMPPQPYGVAGMGMPQPGMFGYGGMQQQPGMFGYGGMQQPGMQQPGMQQPGMQQPGMFGFRGGGGKKRGRRPAVLVKNAREAKEKERPSIRASKKY